MSARGRLQKPGTVATGSQAGPRGKGELCDQCACEGSLIVLTSWVYVGHSSSPPPSDASDGLEKRKRILFT